MKLPRNIDDLVDSGRQNLDSLVDEGRKSARRLYSDGRDWISDHLPEQQEVRRSAKRGAEQARRSADDLLRGPVRWIEEHLPDARDVRRSARRGVKQARRTADDHLRAPVRWIEEHLPEPRRTSSVLLPSVVAAAGAGVAFWWWTSWSRGRAEAAERAALDAAGGAKGKAHPEVVMAHAVEPAEAPVNAPDPSASELTEPAEDVMAHSPPPPEVDPARRPAAGEGAGKATADEARLLGSTSPKGLAAVRAGAAKTAKSLDEGLGVQGAAPKGRSKAGEASA